MHREFSRKSVGERMSKIGPHLPKLLSNIKWLPFLGHSVDIITITELSTYDDGGMELHRGIVQYSRI